MVAIDVIARDKASKKFDTIGKSAQTAADKMAGISKKSIAAGKTMTKKVTLPILAIGAGAVKAADDVGKAMDDIKVATGASGDTLAGLQDVAKNIAKKVPTDIGVISTAIGDLNTLTGATGPVLQDMTTKVLEASRVLGEDGAANAAAFGQTLNAANIPAEKSGKLLDTLFAASQQYGVGMGDMMKQLKMFGPQMSNAGLSMADTVAIFGQFNKAGVSAKRIVPTLNPALLKWAKAGEDPQKMLAGLSDKIAKATTDQEAMSLAAQHFSGPGATAFVNAIRKGGVSLSDLDKSLDTSSVNILKTGKSTRTMGENLTVLKNKAVLSLVPIGQKILPVIIKVFGKLGDIVGKVTKWWDGLSGTSKKFLTIALGVVAAIGPAVLIFGKLIAVGLKVGKAIKMVRTAMIAMNAAMAANPILVVVAVIAALVAAFVYLWNNCESFRNFWIGLWDGIKSVISAVVDWFMDNIVGFFTETIPGIFKSVIDWVKDHWPILLSLLIGPFGLVIGQIVEHWDAIKGAFQAAWDWVKNTFKKLWDGLKEIIIDPVKAAFGWINDKFIAPLKTALSGVWGWVKDNTKKAWETAKTLIIDPLKAVMSWLTGTFSTIKGWFSDLWGAIKSVAKTVWGAFYAIYISPLEKAYGYLTGTFGKIKGWFSSLWGGIKSGAKSIWGGIQLLITRPLGKAYTWVKDTFGKIKGWFTDLWNGIVDKMKGILGGVKGIATDAFSGIAGIIKKPINGIISMINNTAIAGINKLIDGANKVPFVNIPHLGRIPSLAEGGIVKAPTLALVGDAGRGNPEIVAPERMIRRIIREEVRARGDNRPAPHTGPLIGTMNVTGPSDNPEQLAADMSRQLAFAGLTG